MATDEIIYLAYEDVIFLHFDQMRLAGETRFGVEDKNLILSTLARPRHEAIYNKADLIGQVATLYFGFIKNHPWTGGNKCTASAIVFSFLIINGMEVKATTPEIIELVLGIESDRYRASEIEEWLRKKVVELSE